MTIERSQNSQAAETAATQRREAAESARDKVPPQPEQVDRFRAVMQQMREGNTEGGLAQAEQPGLAEDAQALVPEDAGAEAARGQRALDSGVDDRAARRADDLGLSTSSQPPADAAQMMHAQLAMRDASVPTQAPPPAASAQAFADLVERHVRQMAIGQPATADGDGQVLLRMSDATLPGTDLLLSRSGDGWILRADVRSRESYDAIREAGPELARRFAERNLGTLSVESHFNG
ncbi:MAG TPA: hypothetical protein VLK29_07560 [Luteimonas sp.]|nr:hypothetical protein [Luteimonas sp.]